MNSTPYRIGHAGEGKRFAKYRKFSSTHRRATGEILPYQGLSFPQSQKRPDPSGPERFGVSLGVVC